jgi:DNA/RNA-binding domain of Phe-tRNA-synthetase-like protein
MRMSVAPEVSPIVRPGALVFEDVAAAAHDRRLDEPLAEVERRLRASGAPAVVVTAVRTMYKRIGLDPTRRRPSSEALLRRVRRGESLPRVNSVVDVGNWCSLETQLPYGLYDLDRLEGAIDLRLGRPGEQYAGIGKEVVHVADRLTLADSRGPFGNPSSDSARTMVSLETRCALAVIYCPAELGPDLLEHALALTAARMTAFAGGTASRVDVNL